MTKNVKIECIQIVDRLISFLDRTKLRIPFMRAKFI